VLQVITYLARTPLTKARKGGLKDTSVDDLLISLLTVSRKPESQVPSSINLTIPDRSREIQD
jgi:acetyl-CoA acyltransferase 1